MRDRPTCISTFSGIGGLDLGLERAGWRIVRQAESDEWRRGVLTARFPGVPCAEDVRDVGAGTQSRREGLRERGGDADAALERGVEAVDLLCGGFPCQDLSVAGRRAGLDGNRSGLFYEYARVAAALRPRWLLVENVPGLLSSNGGRDFGIVLGTLADLGYGLAWRILDSRYFGVPQRRRRVFILGALADGDPRAAAERAGQVLAVSTRCRRHPPAGTERGPDVAVASLSGLGTGGPDGESNTFIAGPLGGGNDGTGRRTEDDPNLVAYPISQDAMRGEGEALTPSPDAEGRIRLRDPGFAMGGDQAFTLAAAGPGGVGTTSGVRRLTPTECERLQGFPDGWTNLGPDSRRYAALGDAVTVPVAEWIGRRIIEAMA